MKQVINDLQNNARDRLCLWIKDTIMRCEAIDLEEYEVYSVIFTVLTHELVYGAVAIGQSRQNFIDMMRQAYDLYHKIALEQKDRPQ